MLLLLPRLCLAQAASYVSDKDLEVAVRTFSFIYGMPTKGDLLMEVVYDPANADSAAEANSIRRALAARSVYANRTLRAQFVPLAEMGASGSRLVYVTHGLDASLSAVAERAKSGKMLTFSTDFTCVESQKCVMGVAADPNIRIEISRSATDASQLEFSQALKLMIREVE